MTRTIKEAQQVDERIKLHAVELVEISKLVRDKANPNEMNPQQMRGLRESMQRWGFLAPITVDRKTNMIADGEHRVDMYREFGRTLIPAYIVDFKDDAERRLFRQTANKLKGKHDPNKDADELKVLFQAGRLDDLAILIAADKEDFLRTLGEKFDISVVSPRNADELPSDDAIETKVKPGEIWQLGRNRLMCGDSTSREDKSRLLEGLSLSAECVVETDPPYNIGYDYNRHEDNFSAERFLEFLKGWMPDVLEARGAIVFPGEQNLDTFLANFPARDIGVWLKRNGESGASCFYLRKTEPVLFYGKFPKKRETDLFEYIVQFSDFRSTGIWTDRKGKPPGKPIRLLVDVLTFALEPNDKVIDFFGGSGSTIIACEELNHECRTMEKDPAYCDMILTRWEKFTGRKAARLQREEAIAQ